MNTPLRLRIIAMSLLGAPLAAAAIWISVNQYNTQIANAARISEAAVIASTLDQIFATVMKASNTSRTYIISNEANSLKSFRRAEAAIPPLMERLHEHTAGRREYDTAIAALETALQAKERHLEALLRLYENEGFAAVRPALIDDIGLRRLESLRASLTNVRNIEFDMAALNMEQLREGLLLQLAGILSLVFCAAIWTAMLSTTAIRSFLLPLSEIVEHVRRVTASGFVGRLPVYRRDEIGQLAAQVNVMTERLHRAHGEREQAQNALVAERQNLIDAVEALDEGFVAFDDRGLIVQCNQRYRDLYPSVTKIALPGVAYRTLLRVRAESGSEPEAIGRMDAWIAEKINDAHLGDSVECVLGDGRILRKTSHPTATGGRVKVYVDITHIKAAESKLRQLNTELDSRVRERTDDLKDANERLRWLNAEFATLINSAPLAIIALNARREITTWNPATIDLLALQANEAPRMLADLALPDDREEFARFLERVYLGETLTGEFRLQKHNGTAVIAGISASVLDVGSDGAHGAILIINDLTDARALQNQFHQSQKMEVVAELTAGLAHDFNNLLAIVISNLDMLQSRLPKKEKGELHELLAAALRAAMSGVALNRQLLTFSRREAPELRKLDLKAEMEAIAPLFHPTLGEMITCQIEMSPDLWFVSADPSLMQAAILNLAVNARDAMPEQGTLTISGANVLLTGVETASGLVGNHVLITVSDTGEGMPHAVKERAFDPFFSTKGFGNGTGLGLSMVYGFVKQSQGDIVIESILGEGTDILIYLPQSVLPDAPEFAGQLDSEQRPGQGEIVLVVEDNDDLRIAVTRQISEMGYESIGANSAQAALAIVTSNATIDLMLTDIVMPGGMDGRALARETKMLRPELPVIFTSGYSAIGPDTHAALRADGDDRLLSKPIRSLRLAASIGQALGNGVHQVPPGR